MGSIRKVCAAAVAVILLATPLVWAQDSHTAADRKIDRSLRESLRLDGGKKRVIITVRSGYRQEIRKALQLHGDVITSESPLIETVAAEIHSEDIQELAKHPGVTALSDDAIVFAAAASPQGSARGQQERSAKGGEPRASTSAVTGSSSVPTSTLRETLGLPKIPTLTTPTGFGIGVAILDSGIAPNLDFAGRITGFYDFTRGGVPTAPYDDYGHGTHVAGLIGSSGVLSDLELMGVAPRVNLVGLKVLDETGQGRTSNVIKAIEYVVANRARLRTHVINLSLGHPIYAPAKCDPFVRAVEKATDAGLIVVVLAGNFGQNRDTGKPGYTGLTSPGNAPSAITVGAVITHNTITRLDDLVAPYSGRGPTWFDAFAKPDVVAPGHQLASNANVSSYLYGAYGVDSAELILEFAFTTLGVHRLEARAALRNGRGNGALKKIGAVQEGVLRRSFLRNGEYLDQALWAILADEWLQARLSHLTLRAARAGGSRISKLAFRCGTLGANRVRQIRKTGPRRTRVRVSGVALPLARI